MEKAKTIWEELGLPRLAPQSPWHGYSLGAWHRLWDEAAQRAASGQYLENGRISKDLQVEGLKLESRVDPQESEQKMSQ